MKENLFKLIIGKRVLRREIDKSGEKQPRKQIRQRRIFPHAELNY